MKKSSKIVLGIVLVLAGVLFALNALELMQIDIFFDGWWTLFIIVPCTIGLFTEREKTGNLIGVAIGILLLLACQDILSFSVVWKLIVPGIIVLAGLKLIFGGLFGNKANEIMKELKAAGNSPKVGFAAFSGCNLNYENEVFNGAELTAVFGGIKCDLRNAVINGDCAIQVSAIFGGIDILVPPNVNVKVNANALFGGVSNKTKVVQESVATIYVSGLCMFGGVDIK